MLIYVYGTLKLNCSNSHILAGSKLVREDRIHGYKLLDSGFPVARAVDDGSIITGEVWDIGNPQENEQARTTLRRLDMLEGYREGNPEGSMYTREQVRTENGIECSMYVGNTEWFKNNEDWPDEDKVYTWSHRRW